MKAIPIHTYITGHRNTTRRCVLVDLDGTVFNNEHRQHFMEGPEKDWQGFFDAMEGDAVFKEVRYVLDCINSSRDAIIICTGRPADYCDITLRALAHHHVPFDILLMRGCGDKRADADVKFDMLTAIRKNGYVPLLAIDDRPEVVDMWRRHRVPVLQCDATPWQRNSDFANLFTQIDALISNVDTAAPHASSLRHDLYALRIEAQGLMAKYHTLKDQVERS